MASSPAARKAFGLSPCRTISNRVAMAWQASVTTGMATDKPTECRLTTLRWFGDSRFRERSGKRQGPVGNRLHFLAVVRADLAGGFIEDPGHLQAIRHFGQ